MSYSLDQTKAFNKASAKINHALRDVTDDCRSIKDGLKRISSSVTDETIYHLRDRILYAQLSLDALKHAVTQAETTLVHFHRVHKKELHAGADQGFQSNGP